jgi:[acyl-carrier-protein] S-malonyltransferase
VGEGAMASLIGPKTDLALAEAAAKEGSEAGVCVVANDNNAGNIVISGAKAAVDRAIAAAKSLGARAIPLNVSAPFHCPLMQPASDAMAEALDKTPPGVLRIALFANVTAAVVTDPADVKRLLVEQVTGRVRWRESAITMKEVGVDQFVELGGKVLGPMISRTLADVSVTSVPGMADIEALLAEL